MRRILVAVSLLGAGALVGAMGFGGAIAGAATPFTNVIIANDSTDPVPVAGTVSLGTTDANNLDATATHLSRIDTAASKLGFDGGGTSRCPRRERRRFTSTTRVSRCPALANADALRGRGDHGHE